MRLLKILAAMTIALSLPSCTSIDYGVIGKGNGETVYVEVEVEVPGETEYVEVPVYVEVEVPGETEYGEIWVDSDTQTAAVDGVDILWVIDTSGSMHRYDAQLMDGIAAMIGALPESGWRLAMMSNDPMRAQAEAQFPLVPGDDIDDALDMYNAMGRGGREEGFDAAYEYLVNNPYATTWLRPDAALFESIKLTYVTTHEDTMRVFINGALNWDWYYQASDNTVYFTVIPAAHDHVDVAYHYDPDDPHGTGTADTGDTG